jgi:predicted metal-dependent hydrolase
MHKVNYGTQDLFFELKRSERKTLAIEVHPDSSIWAVAPMQAELEEIKNRITKRGQWILKQQQYFEQFLPRTPEREYVSGETHFYLGRGYVLKIREGDKNSVKLKSGELQVISKKPSPELVKKQLAEWYYHHAEKKFKSLLKEVFERFSRFELEFPELEIKRMSRRWGSCTANGKVIINPEIIKAPTKCIEYLITHELCHLIEHSHNKRFYSLLAEQMPSWEKWKGVLERKMS